MLDTAPSAIQRSEADLPFVDLGEGTKLQLLHVDLANGIWVTRNRFAPGATIATHRHTGAVHGFTLRGRWYYLESPDAVNQAGSYLYEPAGSVHTLHAPKDNGEETDVWFTIHGANLHVDGEQKVVLVVDASLMLAVYRHLCREQHGLDEPPVVVAEGPAAKRC